MRQSPPSDFSLAPISDSPERPHSLKTNCSYYIYNMEGQTGAGESLISVGEPNDSKVTLCMLGCAGITKKPFSEKPTNGLGDWNLGPAVGANLYDFSRHGTINGHHKQVGPTILNSNLPATLVVARNDMTLYTKNDPTNQGVKIHALP